MQRFFSDKRAVLLIALLALVSLVLLSGSLSSMRFRPAGSLWRSTEPGYEASINLGEIVKNAADIPFWNLVIFWGLLLVCVVLVTSLLSPELRKRILLAFLRITIFVLGVLYILKKDPDLLAGLLQRLKLPGVPQGNIQGTTAPAPVFYPPHVSSWFSFFVALGLAMLAGLFLWWLSRVWVRFREMTAPHAPFADIARIARASLGELRSGSNFENAVIECYARMSIVVGDRQGLHRENAMTPAEFSMRLTDAGLPREPVEKLTRLFESTRYGGQPAAPADITEAIACLTSIMHYCGERA